MSNFQGRGPGFTFKYLKRDGDPQMSWPSLVLRQVSECVNEVGASLKTFGVPGARLAGWVTAYHTGMLVRPFASRSVATLRLTTNGTAQKVSFRKNQSDLYILRENFVEQIYTYNGIPQHEVTSIVDLGANAGLSALFFQAQFPHAEITCVEPVQMNVELLEQNRSQNGYKWKIIRGAAADRPGQVTLFPNEWWSSSTTTESVANAREGNEGRLEKVLALPPEEVPALTVDQILDDAGFKAVDILKMDIEGAEQSIFEADLSWLPRVRILIIEIHDKYVNRQFIEAQLKEFGFRRQEGRRGPTDAFLNTRFG